MKYKLAFVCFAVTVTFFPILLFSQDRNQKIDAFILKTHQDKLFNGVILVAEKGELIYTKAIGCANMEWNVPHKLNSKFKLASVSKQFTCMLILQLVKDGIINLDAKISEYLPDYPAGQGSKVSIRNLMSHTSGIPNYSNFDNWYSELWMQEYSAEEFLGLFKNLELEFEPGSRFGYSNSGYHVLAAIIERVCGKPFEQVMDERIFQPLNMTDSGCIDVNTVVPLMSSAYEYWESRFTRSDYFNPTTAKGAGSVYSTARDLWKWHKALSGSTLIPRRLTDEFMSKQIDITYDLGYGFGLEVGQVRIDGVAHDYIGHTGAYPGFHSLYAWFPQTDRFIVILNNTGRTKLVFFRGEIIKILEGGDHHNVPPLSPAKG